MSGAATARLAGVPVFCSWSGGKDSGRPLVVEAGETSLRDGLWFVDLRSAPGSIRRRAARRASAAPQAE